ncbi:MAG: DUF4058 family protein [Planctomycetaceae bacterium]|nr:DUF4058 family protein [Planctomycetaceae bacterium]
MPLHDWSRVPAGLFHHFHQDWSIEIARELNRGRLPAGFSALVEQRAGEREPNLLAIETGDPPDEEAREQVPGGGVAIIGRPSARIVRHSSADRYAARANRIVVRHHLGRVVSVIEIVAPGNKSSRAALREFVTKTADFLAHGVHVLVVDLFQPTQHDPAGIHKAIWDEFEEEAFDMPVGKDRVAVSYEAGEERVAYIELIGIGEPIPDMPLFLDVELHIPVPLEKTYETAWNASPQALRAAVENAP